MEAALGGCRELGAAWVASGLGATAGLPALPAWLACAVDDASQAVRATGGQ